jgi:hypothetical protein
MHHSKLFDTLSLSIRPQDRDVIYARPLESIKMSLFIFKIDWTLLNHSQALRLQLFDIHFHCAFILTRLTIKISQARFEVIILNDKTYEKSLLHIFSCLYSKLETSSLNFDSGTFIQMSQT